MTATPEQLEPVGLDGLVASEVAARVADGRINDVPAAPVRSLRDIIWANVFTPVNAIISGLFVLILVAGFPADALFAGVVVSNSVIGVVQELRARSTLNKLEVLNAPRALVMRDGVRAELQVNEVVADDILVLRSGDQVVVDAEVLQSVSLELDESLLTGEADAVEKAVGDEVLSGSFVASGSGFCRATRIGADSYATRLAEEARVFKLADSELRSGVNTIMRWLTWIIPPASLALFLRLLNTEDEWQEALRGTVAAAVAMVPDGLVLLTSLAFIVGVIALARRQALAKELASVELLARVDTLCLDKTGTITTGEISFGEVAPLGDATIEDVGAALGALGASDPNPNATLAAISSNFDAPPGWIADEVTPFSSARKWSGAHFVDQGSFYIGAPEILLGDDAAESARSLMATYTGEGRRVLLLSHSELSYSGEQLAAERSPIALVLLEDTVRHDAPEILKFFRDQGVTLKVISGDNPQTVAAVARRAGVPGAETGTDARDLPEDREGLADALADNAIFGRVTPHQKRAMVGALQSRGHVVAMTGDGVNDVLALKDADMGIAMGSGSSSTRAVAQLVLLDNKFSTLPRVLAEGRRVINNIERVANLFITKATYAVLLTVLVGLFGVPFPFLPRQLTLIGTFSIGIPGFFLALSPTTELVRPGFLRRILLFSIPSGLAAGGAAFTCYELLRRSSDVTLAEARTGATISLLLMGLVILVMISVPLKPWKVLLAVAMAASYVGVMAWETGRDYFELDLPPQSAAGPLLGTSAIGSLAILLLPALVARLFGDKT